MTVCTRTGKIGWAGLGRGIVLLARPRHNMAHTVHRSCRPSMKICVVLGPPPRHGVPARHDTNSDGPYQARPDASMSHIVRREVQAVGSARSPRLGGREEERRRRRGREGASRRRCRRGGKKRWQGQRGKEGGQEEEEEVKPWRRNRREQRRREGRRLVGGWRRCRGRRLAGEGTAPRYANNSSGPVHHCRCGACAGGVRERKGQAVDGRAGSRPQRAHGSCLACFFLPFCP